MYRHMADVIDVTGLQKEVERRAQSNDLRCNFSADVKQPFIAHNTIYLPALPVPFDMDSFRLIRCAYIHELAHFKDKRMMALRKEYPVDITTNLGGIWNILADEFDEYSAAREFPGDAKALGEGHAVLIHRQLEMLLDIIKVTGKSNLDENDHKRLAAYMLAQSTRDWDLYAPPLLVAMKRKLPSEAVDLLHILTEEGWGDKIKEMQTADDVLALAKKLTKRLWPEEDPEKQCQDAKNNKDESGGSGSGKGKGKGKGDSEGGGDEGKGETKEGVNEKLKVIPWEKLVLANHDDSDKLSAQASRIDWTGKHLTGRGFKPASPDQFVISKIHKSNP